MQNLNQIIDTYEAELVESTRQIVKIRSVLGAAEPGMPYGKGVHDALNYALDLSAKMGFGTGNIGGHAGYAEYGDGDEIVAVLGHLDVVHEGTGWTYPPYDAQIHDGKIYGRGTTDDKGPMMAALFGLKAIRELNLKLTKRIRIIFGTNEENGSGDIPHYLEKEKAPVLGFTPDGEFPVIHAEKGLFFIDVHKKLQESNHTGTEIKRIKGGNVHNCVPDFCEAEVKTTDFQLIADNLNAFNQKNGYDLSFEVTVDGIMIKSIGKSAHGSTPRMGKNAIMPLLMFLSELDISGGTKSFIDFFAENIKNETNGQTLGIALKDDVGELTLNVGKILIDNGHAEMGIDMRYPGTFKQTDFSDVLFKKFELSGMEVTIVNAQPPLYFSKDHPLIQTLLKVYAEQTGREAFPLTTGGTTYAKAMPNIVAFGPLFPGQTDYNHQADEHTAINDLLLQTKIYANAMAELAK